MVFSSKALRKTMVCFTIFYLGLWTRSSQANPSIAPLHLNASKTISFNSVTLEGISASQVKSCSSIETIFRFIDPKWPNQSTITGHELIAPLGYSQSNNLISSNPSAIDPKVPLKIGFLSSYVSSKMILGAIPLAVEAINKDPNLLPGRKLEFVAADIGKPENDRLTSLAIQRMTEMRDNNSTIAFIGPDGHHCADQALVAAAWNLPIITHKCSERRLSEMPQKYFTFARTVPPASKISKPVMALLEKFGWNKILIVVGKKNEWIQIKDAIKMSARNKKMEVVDVIYLDEQSSAREITMKTIAESTFQRTRIFIFIGEHVALIHFVRALHGLGVLASGDYVIISIDDFTFDSQKSFRRYTDNNHLDSGLPSMKTENEIQAFRSVLKVTSSYPRNPNIRKVLHKMKEYSSRPPFCVSNRPTIFDDIDKPIYAYHAYDAVMIYAQALTESLRDGYDPRNGTNIMERIRSRAYHSVLGYDVFIDSNGDAEGNYTVYSMLRLKPSGEMTSYDASNYVMQPVGFFQYDKSSTSPTDLPVFLYFNSSRPIDWIGFGPPVAESFCGFTGGKCVRLASPGWRSVLCTVSGVVLIVTIGLASRHYCYAYKLACFLWKVDNREFIITATAADFSDTPDHFVSRSSLLSGRHGPNKNNSNGEDNELPGKDDSPVSDLGMKRFYTSTGRYKGNVVAIKTIRIKSFSFTNNVRRELKQVSGLRHENIVSFMGVSVEHGSVSILTAYCPRGSLEDILKYRDFKLDTFFIASLVTDLIKGMIFLHESEIVSHGSLQSSNCLVDSRWVLQITDFGLHELKAFSNEHRTKANCVKRLLWKAPELLRDPSPPPRGTQKGDVFSFGIILFEIFGRKGPWGDLLDTMSPTDIVERLTHPEWFPYKCLRPPISLLNCKEYIVCCIQECWHETPEMRPNFKSIRGRLKEMEAGLNPNIFDSFMIMNEKYTYNLEGLVQERTDQLVKEKKKTEALLHSVLPKSVVESLKRGEPVKAESFDSVTIYFSDIVGFTFLSAVSTPLQVVGLLNELYTLFDSILENYDAYKVETIGDAYMVASGLPIRNHDYHAAEIASLALHLLSEIRNFRIRHRPGETLKLRIGIHSGPCVAGVVGLKMPRYCLFGDTVNTASRMESTGQALRIHISAATKELLDRLGGFVIEERGITSIRGKGEMMTYWLAGEEAWRTGRRRSSAVKREMASTTRPTDANPQIGPQSPTMLDNTVSRSNVDAEEISIPNIHQKFNNDVRISVDSGTTNSFGNLWQG